MSQNESFLNQVDLFFRDYVRAMRKVTNAVNYLNEFNIIIYGANTLGNHLGELNIITYVFENHSWLSEKTGLTLKMTTEV